MPPEISGNEKGPILLGIARHAIATRLGLMERRPFPKHPWLREYGACFVTLHKGDALRGCIGSLTAHRPLGEDVMANALAAAFQDPRFDPLTRDEFEDIRIEVSVLSKPERVFPADEAGLIAKLRPGVDGLTLEYGPHRSTFLPQVWEQLPDGHDFLAHLKQKGGLPSGFWHPDMRVSRYTVQAFAENRGRQS